MEQNTKEPNREAELLIACHEEVVANLKAELAALRQSHAAIYAALGTQEADHMKWPEQITALRLDKERLDWQEENFPSHTIVLGEENRHRRHELGSDGVFSGPTFRAAIDAAMKEGRT